MTSCAKFLGYSFSAFKFCEFFGDTRVEFLISYFSQENIRAGPSVQSNSLVATVA